MSELSPVDMQDDVMPAVDLAVLIDASIDTEVPEWDDPFVLDDLPDRDTTAPFYLSQVGLYSDISQKTLNIEALAYTPEFALWSDGTEKQRWVILPANAVIDTSEMDFWQFPVGTRLFKEFGRNSKRFETRLIVRTGEGPRDYWMGSFLWDGTESNARFVKDGALNVHSTDHDVPEVKACGTCHNGLPGKNLGFSALQLSNSPGPTTLSTLTSQDLLSHPPQGDITVPGQGIERAFLGYINANCGHCHNNRGAAWPDTDVDLTLSVSDQIPQRTQIYETTIGIELQYFNADTDVLRVTPGQPDRSAMYLRMEQRGLETQMPPLATKHVDEVALELMRQWINQLEPLAP